VLRRIRKNGAPEEYEEAVHRAREAGMRCEGYFMFGFPDETVSEMEETLSFAMKLPLDKRNFGTCLPFPGTLSHERLLEKSGLERIDWESYDFSSPGLLPSQASPDEVREMLRKARRSRIISGEGVRTVGWMVRFKLGTAWSQRTNRRLEGDT